MRKILLTAAILCSLATFGKGKNNQPATVIKRGSPNLRLENQPAMAGTRPDKRQEEWIERGNAALQL